jgi:hypothetical protein
MASGAYGILKQVSSCMVDPPSMITVTITTREVAVSIDWRASDTVFLIAKAKAIAPRKPATKINQLGTSSKLNANLGQHRLLTRLGKTVSNVKWLNIKLFNFQSLFTNFNILLLLRFK